MDELGIYIKYLKEIMPNNLDELSVARYVYIDLGRKMSFDPVYAFGNSKEKNSIYNSIKYTRDAMNEYLRTGVIICKSLAYLYEYILGFFDINVCTTEPITDKHVHNIITLQNRKRYSVDLQLDLENIQSRSKTKFFAIDNEHIFSVLTTQELAEIDNQIGYIENKDDYTDDRLNIFKSSLEGMLEINEKVDFILKYLYSSGYTKIMQLIESYSYHQYVFEGLLSKDSIRKVHFAYCYEMKNGKKDYLAILSVDLPGPHSKTYIFCKGEFTIIPADKLMYMLKTRLIIRHGTIFVYKKHLTNTSSFHRS